MWQLLFSFSHITLAGAGFYIENAVYHYVGITKLLYALLAPFLGLIADVEVGRYEIIKLGTISSFIGSVFFYFALFTGGVSVLSTVLSSIALVLGGFGNSCFLATLVPFLADQLIGATSDELSAVVQWYVWIMNFAYGLSFSVNFIGILPYYKTIGVGIVALYAVPLALIIISDCLCLQWLNRTHKVTNPIKLIIQVLNYTRKHRYPERRSAFTYLDEEQPSRMDFGKQKFGGPFTEEEVEDVKTLLRLIPLLVCVSITINAVEDTAVHLVREHLMAGFVLNTGLTTWLFPILLIPFYRLVRPLFHAHIPSMLKSMEFGLLLVIIGYILLEVAGIWGVVLSKMTDTDTLLVQNCHHTHFFRILM